MSAHQGRLRTRMLSAAGGLAWLSASLALVARVPGPAELPITLVVIAGLIFLPLLQRAVIGRLTGWMRDLGLVLFLGLHPLILLALPTRDPLVSVVLAVVVVLVGHAEGQTRWRPAALFLALTAFVMPPFALCLGPSLAQLLLVPVGCTVCWTCLVLIESGRTFEKVRGQVEYAGASDSEGERGRLTFSLGISVVLVAASVAGLALRSTLPELIAQEEEAPEVAEEEVPEAPIMDTVPREDRRFERDLDLGGGRGAATSDEPALYVHVEQGSPARAGEVLYLRGRVLDTFTGAGVTLRESPPPERRDADDGRRDGWVRLESGPAREPRTLVVQPLIPFSLPEGAGELAFLPDRALEIEAPSARYGADSFCTTPGRQGRGSRYAVRHDAALPSWRELADQRLQRGDARYVQLPPSSEALDTISALAREWITPQAGDLERVLEVVLRLRSDFEYDVAGTGFGGTEAMATFLERGSGYCSYFASTAALMLRTQGIPARVVTGFSASERTEANDAWLVRRRHGHVWIEVPFEGLGWVSFDPTPGATGRADGLVSDDRGDLARWMADLQRWLEGGSGSPGLGSLLGKLISAGASGARAHPSVLLLFGAATLGLLSFLRRSRPSPVLATLEGTEASLYRRLLGAVARRGHRPRQGQTLLAFARGLAEEPGPGWAQLPDAAGLFYRAAYGKRSLDAEETRRMEALVLDLERTDEGTKDE